MICHKSFPDFSLETFKLEGLDWKKRLPILSPKSVQGSLKCHPFWEGSNKAKIYVNIDGYFPYFFCIVWVGAIMTKELQLPSQKIIAQADWMPSEDDAAQAPVGGVAWIFQG